MTSPSLGLMALGLVTPLGLGKAAVAKALFAGTRCFTRRDDLIPGAVINVGAIAGDLPPLPQGFQLYDSRNNRLAALAVQEIAGAVANAIARFGADRIAVVMGTSTSGIAEGEAAFATHSNTGAWPSAFHYRQQETGSLGAFVATLLGITGPAYTVATACSSSGKAFASAARLIRAGFADAAIVGGVDTLCRTTTCGFASLGALSPGLCNPFSRHRDGINIGEAGAIFLLSPEPASVMLAGIGETSDAHHVSAPDPSGTGAIVAMRDALTSAGLTARDIAYLNLHGTATPLNDAMEGKAVHAVFGDETPCSSTKALTGHTLGAAGACEAAFLYLTLDPEFNGEDRMPPHTWDGAQDPAIPTLDLVEPGRRLSPRGRRVAALSTSFAFGGSNVALVLERRTK